MPSLVEFDSHKEGRGELIVIDEFPFDVKRYFDIRLVPREQRRANHAHRECHQILRAVSGTVTVTLDDGQEQKAYRLSSPTMGLYVEPMVWIQVEFGPGAILGVFCSHLYNKTEEINDYDEFLEMTR